MFQPQFISSPDGAELVVLARADYEALIEAAREAEEDEADVAAYDAAKAAPAKLQRLLPDGVLAHLNSKTSLLKAWRLHAGLTQAQMAEAAGIGQGYLSELEAVGRTKKPSTAVLHGLASAIRQAGVEIDPDWLISMES